MAVPTISSIAAAFRAAFLANPDSGALDNSGLTAFCTALATALFQNSPGTTAEGGFTVTLKNKTGASSVRGTIVEPSSSTNSAFDICPAGSYDPIGIVYDNGIADGSDCRIVIAGVADILLEDTLGSTRGHWLRVSDTDDGRVYSASAPSGGFPSATAEHFREVGHSLQTVTGGTDQLVRAMLHWC